eukprot:TRINITY_DN8983_c0_g1_i9.p1 TRINITY_DN8983_c0_g1~~TRINITY_DN8983_c0_g1_i9.p1  ORF type:complete len:227 (+),score=60.71 TRINITY_DN8983_c0_g1_i9:98-682(+)
MAAQLAELVVDFLNALAGEAAAARAPARVKQKPPVRMWQLHNAAHFWETHSRSVRAAARLRDGFRALSRLRVERLSARQVAAVDIGAFGATRALAAAAWCRWLGAACAAWGAAVRRRAAALASLRRGWRSLSAHARKGSAGGRAAVGARRQLAELLRRGAALQLLSTHWRKLCVFAVGAAAAAVQRVWSARRRT